MKIKRLVPILALCLLLLSTMLMSCGVSTKEEPVQEEAAEQTLSARDEIVITSDAVPDSAQEKIREAGVYERFEYTAHDEDGNEVEKYANVYLPYGYDQESDTKYPVMYLFHGYGGSAQAFMGSPRNPSEIKYMVDNLFNDGKAKPMIIVNASYYTNNEEDGENNYDMEILENFRSELVNDLIPAVDARYQTYADRDHRIMAGFSMGSVMTISRMMDSMEYFRYFFAMSGSIFWSVHNTSYPGTRGGSWAGEYIAEKIQDQGYTKDDFYLFAATGSEDYAKDTVDRMIDSMAQNTDMFTLNNETASGNMSYIIGDGEKHNDHGKLVYLYNGIPVVSALMQVE